MLRVIEEYLKKNQPMLKLKKHHFMVKPKHHLFMFKLKQHRFMFMLKLKQIQQRVQPEAEGEEEHK